MHARALTSGTEIISVSYGPILPDVETKAELNQKLKDGTFTTLCKGMILPHKKEVKRMVFTQESLMMEGEGSFQVTILNKDLLRVENSLSDGKAIKMKAVKESRLL